MSTRKPLYKRSFLAILVCGVLYLFVHYALPMILYGAGLEEPWPILMVIATNALLWFVIVPFGFRLPTRNEKINALRVLPY